MSDFIIQQTNCPACNSTKITTSLIEQCFEYGTGADEIKLCVVVPVHHCPDCDLEYTGAQAEDLRHEVVERLQEFEKKAWLWDSFVESLDEEVEEEWELKQTMENWRGE